MKKTQISAYNQLVMQIEKVTEKHPRSQVVIDVRTRQVIFVGTNSKKVEEVVRKEEASGRMLIVSQKPSSRQSFHLSTFK